VWPHEIPDSGISHRNTGSSPRSGTEAGDIFPVSAALEHAAGDFTALGTAVLFAGDRLRPQDVAMAASVGRPRLGGVPFIGLPGNPAAAMVALVMVARPLALRLAGANRIESHRFQVAAGQVFARSPDRRHFLRGRLEHDNSGVLTVRKFRSDSSGMLSSLTWSDGLIDPVFVSQEAREAVT
jgi:molybdopterin biosynthesis enzyme